MAAKTISSRKLRFAVLAIDVVLFTILDKELQVLLMHIHRPPYFVNRLGVPGGLIHPDETAEEAAQRHLSEKAGFSGVSLEQIGTFSRINRDPRGRVVSIAFLGLVSDAQSTSSATHDVLWQRVDVLPQLAYDHNEIVERTRAFLREKISHTGAVSALLSSPFTFSDLQHVYETILGYTLDKRNFRKKITILGLLKRTGKKRAGAAHRPAALYAFAKKRTIGDAHSF